ncbi:hypothetical protein Bbelb_150030 [Branchiostoma belcheri]|nr:hypothetical protein Bbelb_150030 [Branchiostoma belcheri]
MFAPIGVCFVCEALNRDGDSTSHFPFLAGVNCVAIRGYPLHELSAEKLAPIKRSEVNTLALIDAKIVDVKNYTFSDLPRLERLSLDSNRLTNVKRAWFTGLDTLLVLVLSNNSITQIEPGSFMNLRRLLLLDLENNLLQVVDPAWLFGLEGTKIQLILRSNAINIISPGSFQHLQLTSLDLRDNDLSCLDKEVLWGQSSLSRLHVSSGMLLSAHDAMSHQMMWRLDRGVQRRSLESHWLANVMEGSATMVVEVPKFHFCARHNTYGLSFGWVFNPSRNKMGNTDLSAVFMNPGKSCGDLDSSLSTISIQAPVVVLASDGSLADKLDTDTLEQQCRQVWEYKGGITVVLVRNVIFRLVSMATDENTEGVAMTLAQTPDTSTSTATEPDSSQKQMTNTNITHSNRKNITCILLTRGEHKKVFFTVPSVQSITHTTETSYGISTKVSSSLIRSSESTEKDDTSSKPTDQSTREVSTSPGQDLAVARAPGYVLIPVVVSVVVFLAMSFLAVLMWKVCAARVNTDDDRGSDNACVWTIPNGVTFPSFRRPASLLACPHKMTSDVVVSCRSWPAVLHSIEPTYSEIPDGLACAQRPLPGLPDVYWKVQDGVTSGVVRSASLPACSLRDAPEDVTSCRSLPAALESIKPTYSQIPDHLAAAQRPLPALPRTWWEIQDHEASAQRPLPVLTHTYSEIPDDKDSGPKPLYSDVAEFSLHVVTNGRQNRRPGRSIATYGSTGQTNGQRNPLYRNASQVKSIMGCSRQLRAALVSQPAAQCVRKYVINVTDAIMSRGQYVIGAHLPAMDAIRAHRPSIYWPWEMPREGTHNTARRASLPNVTPPNTYWPWEIPGEGACNTPRRASLPTVTLPNTYWPWEIPGEGACNTPRRASLPTVTLPNTYWPWEIPGEGACNTPRRASLPTVTLPNTYWPWEIPGEGIPNTPRRASLPTVTLPNTYWPWEIPGEGACNTPRRASLPTVTLPNTYWPWEIPGREPVTHQASLPTLSKTYWPWDIPGVEIHNTPRRASLHFNLLNT